MDLLKRKQNDCSFLLCTEGKQAAYEVKRRIWKILHPDIGKDELARRLNLVEERKDKAINFWLDYCGSYGRPNE